MCSGASTGRYDERAVHTRNPQAPTPVSILEVVTVARLRAGVGAFLLLALCACTRITATPAPGPPPPGPPPPTAPVLRLSPDSGPPGTVITVSGTVTPSEGSTYDYGTLCFGGCAQGLREQGIPIAWSGDAFTAWMVVPTVPWIAPDGPQQLVPGAYAIEATCVRRQPKAPLPCDLQPAQAAGTFRLTGPVRPAPTVEFRFSPNSARPGDTVRVSGWAPLSPLLGATPAGYNLVAAGGGESVVAHLQQDVGGDLSGTLTLPSALPGSGVLGPGTYRFALESNMGGDGQHVTLLPPAELTVSAAPALTWTDLGGVRPLWIQQAVGQREATDPADPPRQARCTTEGLQVSVDGGRTWSPVSTAGVLKAAAATPYTLFPSGRARLGAPLPCATVALDPGHPETIYAAFVAAFGNPPPEFWLPFETLDGGRTWRLLPVPAGANPTGFGRFLPGRHTVQALYATRPAGKQPEYAVTQTTDGGRTWRPGSLRCPDTGPCVVWGPAPNGVWPGVCGAQPLLASENGGQTWSPPKGVSHVCYVGTGPAGPYELAALSPTEVALLGQWNHPLMLSRDGGLIWADVALPLPPGRWNLPLQQDRFPDLRMSSDGRLQIRGGWVLAPGARQWCRPGTGATSCTGWIPGDAGSSPVVPGRPRGP